MSASAPSTAAPAASAANAPAPSTDSAAGAQGQAAAPQSSPSAALAPAAGNKVTPPYASGSLYVGDLTADVTEALLFDTFNAVGPVASVRVCRDAATRRSLGYAYVNFINLLDAERALDTMNFTAIKGRPCRIMWSHRDPSLRKSGVGNIFVKNLSKSIDNKALFDTFSVFGNILSCKVAVNAKRESLGYGFVQFGDAEAAQNAIDQVNGMSIAGEKVSVQAFKSKKERMGGSDAKKQYTNVYVKNLPMDFNKKKLDELFGKYGAITSSTLSVYTAEEWKEKLENDERRAKQKKEKEEKAAAEAAKDGKPAAEPKKDGETGAGKDGKPAADKSSPTANEANKEFKGDRCKGFGFVNFTTAAQAQAAVDGLNGTELGGKKLFVARAQKKEERERELREKFEAFKAERQKKYAGVNLYVKNLADSIDEKKLQTEFAKFGSITSLKIMHDDKKKSRGFGFVCFSSPDEATKAVTEMNGRMVDGKPLYVALAQRKEVRRAQLEQQYAARQRGGGGRDNGNGPANGMAGQNGMFQPGPFMYPAGPNQFGGGRGFFPNQGMQPRRVPYPQQQPGQPFPPQVLYGVPPQNPMNPAGMMNPMGFARGQPMGVQYQLMPAGGAKGGMPMGRGGAPMGGPGPNQGPRRGGGRGNPRGGMQQGGRGGAMGGPMPGGRGAGAGRGAAAGPGAAQPMKAPTAPAAAPEPAATEPLTASMLAAAPEDTRKQMIGERLFPLIQNHQPKLAGKITGMLLEMDNGELLHLLESQSSLMEKITEAINVLRDSEHEEAGMAVADGAAPTSA